MFTDESVFMGILQWSLVLWAIFGRRLKRRLFPRPITQPAPRKYPRVGGVIDGTDDYLVEVSDCHYQTWSRENVMKEIAAGRAYWAN